MRLSYKTRLKTGKESAERVCDMNLGRIYAVILLAITMYIVVAYGTIRIAKELDKVAEKRITEYAKWM